MKPRTAEALRYLALLCGAFVIEIISTLIIKGTNSPVFTDFLAEAFGASLGVFSMAFILAWLIGLKAKQRSHFTVCLILMIVLRLLAYFGEYAPSQR